MTDLQARLDALAQSGMWTPAVAVGAVAFLLLFLGAMTISKLHFDGPPKGHDESGRSGLVVAAVFGIVLGAIGLYSSFVFYENQYAAPCSAVIEGIARGDLTGLSTEQVSSIRKKCDEDAFIAASLLGKGAT